MLKAILGSKNKENVLLFLAARDSGYPREISKYYETDLSPIQNQLDRLEQENVVSSRLVGRTRVYTFNPRYPFLKELKALIEKAIEFLPEEEKSRLLYARKRPRRKGKPL